MPKVKVAPVEKSWLQKFRESESSASVVFGAIVVVVVGILLFNYSKANTPSSISDQGQATEAAAQLPANHVVAQGENLWSVAEKYYGDGNKWPEIAGANNLVGGGIDVGQNLTIPSLTKAEEVPVESGKTYSVKAGDCLWDIAVATYGDGYKWTEIYKANSSAIADPNLIYVGQVISLP